MDAGRNLMAYYGDDDTIRTRYPLRIISGRTGHEFDALNALYPSSNTIIPRGTSLKEILRHYPYHAWGRGLRLFLAEGLTANEMYEMLPRDARNNDANSRQWNYLQKAFERQARSMQNEQDAIDRLESQRSPTPAAPPAAAPPPARVPVTRAQPSPVVASGVAESNVDPQVRPHAQPAAPLPLLQQIQALIQREYFDLLVDTTMMMRELVMGFTELSSEEQRRRARENMRALMARYERELEQEIPAGFESMISIQESGSARILQLLNAIIDLNPVEPVLPSAQQQVARTDYRAHQRLLARIQRFRQSIAKQRIRLQRRSDQDT